MKSVTLLPVWKGELIIVAVTIHDFMVSFLKGEEQYFFLQIMSGKACAVESHWTDETVLRINWQPVIPLYWQKYIPFLFNEFLCFSCIKQA